MTLEQAAQPRGLRNDSNPFRQTLPPQSREIGDVILPKQAEGAPVAAQGSPFARSWAHLVAGG